MRKSIVSVASLVLIVLSNGYGQGSIVLSIEQGIAADSLLTALDECTEVSQELSQEVSLYRGLVDKYRSKELLFEQRADQYKEGQRLQTETLGLCEAEITKLKKKNQRLKFYIIGVGVVSTAAIIGILVN